MVRWLLEHSDDEMLLWVRGNDESELRKKRKRLGELAENTRCQLVGSDLTAAAPFSGVDATRVTAILHCAAVTSFSTDRETAEINNIGGTRKVLEFAGACPRLERVGLLSTLYSAGLRTGPMLEQPLPEAEAFANHYEWSKWHSEKLVDEFPSLPWQIYRMATVLAEDESGRVEHHNAVHNTLRLLYYGLLSIVPGSPDTRVYLVTAEFACRAIGHLFLEAASHGIFHVSDDGASAIRLGDMIDVVYDTFLENEKFAKQGILKPLFCDWQAFETLAEGSSQFASVISQALDSVTPFAPQLYCDKDVQTTHCDSVLGGVGAPDSGRLMRAVCRYLVATRWGLQAVQ